MRNHWLFLLGLLALCARIPQAHAAASTDTCTKTITSLPATFTTAGRTANGGDTVCLKKDFTVTFAAGPSTAYAIEVIGQNNITIDCNGFTITQGVPNSGQTTYGIFDNTSTNLTVRNCGLKSFNYGIQVGASASATTPYVLHLEDNRLDSNGTGIFVDTGGTGGGVVRRNQIVRSTSAGIVINGSADVVDNTVSVVAATAGSGLGVSGIQVNAPVGAHVEHNQVVGLAGDGSGLVYGIQGSGSTHLIARRNTLVGSGSAGSVGFSCSGGSGRAMDNVFVGFASALDTCGDAGGNDISP